MTIKTTGSAQGDSFKTSKTGLSGGFVKNDASGNFEFDQPGAGGPPVIGGSIWDLIETKNIASDVTTITFAGLDGDVDKVYKMVFRNKYTPATNNTWSLRPNGLTTNQISVNFNQRNAGSTNPSLFVVTQLNILQQRLVHFGGTLYFNAATGQIRQMIQHLAFDRTSLGRIGTSHTAGAWTDTTTNVTSLVVASAVAGGITAGSIWSLYRINE